MLFTSSILSVYSLHRQMFEFIDKCITTSWYLQYNYSCFLFYQVIKTFPFLPLLSIYYCSCSRTRLLNRSAKSKSTGKSPSKLSRKSKWSKVEYLKTLPFSNKVYSGNPLLTCELRMQNVFPSSSFTLTFKLVKHAQCTETHWNGLDFYVN